MERLISPPAGSIVEVRMRRQNLRNWCTRPSEANGRIGGGGGVNPYRLMNAGQVCGILVFGTRRGLKQNK
jgi:hypothetical protein